MKTKTDMKIELPKEAVETIAAILWQSQKRQDIYDLFISRVIDAVMTGEKQ